MMPNFRLPQPVYGALRVVAQGDNRFIASDGRDLSAHFNDDGDLFLVGQYQGAFVEVALTNFVLEQLYRRSQHIRNETTPESGDTKGVA